MRPLSVVEKGAVSPATFVHVSPESMER